MKGKQTYKMQDGGIIDWFMSLFSDDEPKAAAPKTPRLPGKYKINDLRKVSGTTGRPIDPKTELLTGQYDGERMENIVKAAKRYGIDPYTALAIDLQETGLGNNSPGSIGHTMMDFRQMIPTKMPSEEESDEYDMYARAIATKMQYADKLGIKDPLVRLQVYNGLGKIFPETEQDYHGFKMKKIYGVTVPRGGIDMRKNPLYGKRVSDIRDNILRKDKNLDAYIRSVKKKGGVVVDSNHEWAHIMQTGGMTPAQMQSVMNYMGVKPTAPKQPITQAQANYIVNNNRSNAIGAINTRQQAETKRNTWVQNQVRENEEAAKQRVAERKAATATRNENKPFTFPSGETKMYEDMDWREKAYVAGMNLQNVGRINQDEETWYDEFLNPLNAFGYLSSGLGTAPYQARETDSYLPYVTSIGSTLAAGALTPALSKIPNVNPIRSGINFADRNFSNVGRSLARIEKKGRAAGLSDFEIAQQQMNDVGITSNQRKAYVPVLSRLAEKYVTPYGYDGAANTSKLNQIWSNIKEGGVRYANSSEDKLLSRADVSPSRGDAWRLYLGLPQKSGTFRLAETAPFRHPSYTAKQLQEMDIYSINTPEGLRGIRPSLDADKSYFITPNQIEKSIAELENPITIEKQHEIMGGYNKRLNQYGLEYNDIWDLDVPVGTRRFLPKSLQENDKILFDNPITKRLFSTTKNTQFGPVNSYRTFNIPVSKIFGKPFMSHGVLPYTSNDQTNLLKLVMNRELRSMIDNPSVYAPKIDKYQNVLQQLEQFPKRKKGGAIVDPRGQWAHPGEETIIPTINGNITMKNVPYPVYGQDETGYGQMMMPGGEYTFPGQMVYETPMMAGGGEMIRRADGSYSRRGLWDNIRANKGSGKKPTKEMLKQERKIKAKEMKNGGTNNPGFEALPEYVQAKILANMGYGGYFNPIMAQGGEPNGEMALGQMAAVQDKMNKLLKFVKPDDNLDPWIASKLAVMDHSADAIADYMMYGPDSQEMEEMEQMKKGGYVVTRSNDRKGKTHKVTGPDGTVKYFGDSKLGQHPKDPERKKAFYARHKKNLDNNPYFRAFARATWQDGGEIYEMANGGYIGMDGKRHMSSTPTWSGNAGYEMGGPVVGDEMEVTPEQLEQLRAQGYQFEII